MTTRDTPHTCQRCHTNINHLAPQSKYCKQCRIIIKQQQDKKRYKKKYTSRKKRGRTCKDCGISINHRYHNAKRCKDCARKRQQEKRYNWDTIKRPNRQWIYDRNTLFKPGTINLGEHANKDTKMEARIIHGEWEKIQHTPKGIQDEPWIFPQENRDHLLIDRNGTCTKHEWKKDTGGNWHRNMKIIHLPCDNCGRKGHLLLDEKHMEYVCHRCQLVHEQYTIGVQLYAIRDTTKNRV